MKTRIVQTTPLFSTEDWDNEPTQPDVPVAAPMLGIFANHFPLANALLTWQSLGQGDELVAWLGAWDWDRTDHSGIPSIFE